MAGLQNLAEPAVSKLLRADVDQLYEQLGIRVKALTLNPEKAGSFDLEVQYDQAEMGLKEDVLDLGRKIFHRWNAEARNLVCGQGPDEEVDRGRLREAFGLGEVAVGATLAALLVANLGVAPAVAGVVAAIICKRFLRPAYEEFCAIWARSLDHSANP